MDDECECELTVRMTCKKKNLPACLAKIGEAPAKLNSIQNGNPEERDSCVTTPSPKRKRSEKKKTATSRKVKKPKTAVTYRCAGFCHTCDPDGKAISNRASHRRAFPDHDIVKNKRDVHRALEPLLMIESTQQAHRAAQD